MMPVIVVIIAAINQFINKRISCGGTYTSVVSVTRINQINTTQLSFIARRVHSSTRPVSTTNLSTGARFSPWTRWPYNIINFCVIIIFSTRAGRISITWAVFTDYSYQSQVREERKQWVLRKGELESFVLPLPVNPSNILPSGIASPQRKIHKHH